MATATKEVKRFGYIRVPASDKNKKGRAYNLIKEGNVLNENIFIDPFGKVKNDERFRTFLNQLNEGDIVVIESLMFMAIQIHELYDRWQKIVKKGVEIEVIDMPEINTNQKDSKVRQEVFKAVFLYFKDAGNLQAKRRQLDENAMEKPSAPKGRPHKEGGIHHAIDLMDKVDIPIDEACRIAGITTATFYNYLGANNVRKTYGGNGKGIVERLKEMGLFA